MEEIGTSYQMLVRQSEGKRPLEDSKLRFVWEDTGKTVLPGMVSVWAGFSWLTMGTGGSLLCTGNEHSASINDRDLLDQLSDYRLLKLASVP
jgi:hypothetical protein